MRKRWTCEVKFDPRDIWVGLFWDAKELPPPVKWHFYICLLPMCVVHIYQVNAEVEDTPRRYSNF